MKIKMFKVNKSVILFIFGTFISNIGNGMFSLIVGQMLYAATGSVGAFGLILIIQNLSSLLLNIIAGYVADLIDAKKVSVYINLIQGVILLGGVFSCLMFAKNIVIILMVINTILSICSPFFRAANFKLIPEVERHNITLLSFNGIRSSANQSGQLIGVALAAPLLLTNNPVYALGINSGCFLITSFMMNRIILVRSSDSINTTNDKNVLRSMYLAWFSMIKNILENKKLTLLIVFSIFDYISVSFVNLIEPKFATEVLANSAYISILDGGFALGAISSFLLVERVLNRWSFSGVAPLLMLLQAICYCILGSFPSPFFSSLVMFLIGLINGSSIAVFQTELQKTAENTVHGKLSSLRDIFVAFSTLVFIPIFTHIVDNSIFVGIDVFVGVLAIMSLLLYFSRFAGANKD